MTSRLLVTGGSGLLGKALRKSLPEARFPTSSEFDVTNPDSMEGWLRAQRTAIDTVLHAAAFTSPPKVDQDPSKALQVNITGTANVVDLCMRHGFRLIYISTDYVFSGDSGNYSETDPLYPVNKYAWSKLGGECAVRLYDNALIVRTSFGAVPFPYEKAFIDQYTSREPVGVIAEKIALLAESDQVGVIHVGSARRTVFEYARSIDPAREILPLTLKEVPFCAPHDTSLNTQKYEALKAVPQQSRGEG